MHWECWAVHGTVDARTPGCKAQFAATSGARNGDLLSQRHTEAKSVQTRSRTLRGKHAEVSVGQKRRVSSWLPEGPLLSVSHLCGE